MKLNEEIRNKNPFKVPEGYFDTLTERAMSAVKSGPKEEEKTEARTVRKISLRPFLSLAAAMLAVAVISTVMVRLVGGSNKTLLAGTDSEIYAGLYAEEIDMYMIENEWSLNEALQHPVEDSGLSSEAIIDYLILENVDINEIYELL